MSRPRQTHPCDTRPWSTFPWRSALAAVLAVSVLIGLPAFTDDTNLLRFDTAKPYVFIILDTSASMGLEFNTAGDSWTPGGADGPGSRIYQAKQALFNTFREVNDVHFGFAGFNQDRVRAYQKHWIYYHEGNLPAGWPIDFPRPDGDSTAGDGDLSALTQLIAIPDVDADGNVVVKYDEDGNVIEPEADTRILEIEGHLLTFGKELDVGREAGSCGSPLDLDSAVGLAKAQSFAINGLASPTPTRLWLESGNDSYLLEVTRPGNKDDGTVNKKIGQDSMSVKLDLYEYARPSCPFTPSSPDHQATLQMRLDSHLGDTFLIDSTEGSIGDGSNRGTEETTAGLWEHQDVVSEADFGSRPFTGKGWESNYDSGGTVVDPDFQSSLDAEKRDRYCASADAADCEDVSLSQYLESEVRPTVDTIFDSDDRRALDYGDMIPFHWSLDRRSQFLDRLAPGYSSSSQPDFRGASFFRDGLESGAAAAAASVGANAADLPLQLKSQVRRPLLALDRSPLARAINDMRCWYLGQNSQGSNKCHDDNPVVETGWEELACQFDNQFGCRKPYLIIISDGEDNSSGENPTADVSDLQGKAGTRTWVLNLGEARNCSNGLLHSIVQSSGKGNGRTGECINVDSGSALRQELESILGQIRTEVKAFASAAVPTVQATVEQKIFLTNFTPFNDSGFWDGHIQAFLKPLPVDGATGKPDADRKCGQAGIDPDTGEPFDAVDIQCFLWDARDSMLAYQYAVEDDSLPASQQVPLLSETDRDLRRVYYAETATAPGEWAENRRLFQQASLTAATQEVRFDLWDALGITGYAEVEPEPADGETHVNQSQYDAADEAINFVLRKKTGTVLDSSTGTETAVSVLLGDIFHSTPQVIGTPPNLLYYAKDTHGEAGGECLPGNGNENKGYRCFFDRHRLRRKMLVVGANDGQLHAFDAGRFRGHENSGAIDFFTGLDLVNEANPDGSFDNGTGLELFSYVPQMVMPTLNEQEDATSQHYFNVDGNITVADVYIDPVADGATFPAESDRQWRTVLVGGLREGGAGYYALDVTQPDPLEEHDDLGIVPEIAAGGDNNNPASVNYVPGCLGGSIEEDEAAAVVGVDCGPVPFPAVVWEFTDRVYNDATGLWYQLDEDRDWMEDPDSPFTGSIDESALPPSFGLADLGDSWSTPNIGRILICGGSDCQPGGDDLEERYVAVFGGGMDVEGKTEPRFPYRGNWLYMVDIETGQAIYKQRLEGAAPAEPAAVDITGDGYFDRIYIGTLAGSLYRVDLGLVAGEYPELEAVEVTGIHPSAADWETTQERLPRDVWVPVQVFDANFDAGFNVDGSPVLDADGNPVDQDAGNFRPIYYRVSIIFQADNEGYILAFGTGDREDLWSLEDVEGRFYMLVDPFASTDDITAPLNESDLGRVEVDGASLGDTDLLQTGGWYLVLASKERVITEAFALSGLTIFSAYEPKVFIGEDATAGQDVGDGTGGVEEERVCGDSKDVVDSDTVCSLRGVSNIYVVNTTNANGLLFDAVGSQTRTKVVADFVTNPFTEQGQAKRSSANNGGGGSTADELSDDLKKVMEALKDLFPAQCQFANYRVDVKTIAADTSLQFIAPIPVCIIEHNWKEF